MPRRRKCLTICVAASRWAKANWLLIATLVGVLLGVLLGFILRMFDLSERTIEYVGVPGDLFMRALYMLVGPLVLSSVISGVAGVQSEKIGRVGAQVVFYYLLTTALAATIGVSFGLIMKPGSGIRDTSIANNTMPSSDSYLEVSDVILDLLRNLVPDNIVSAMMQTESTKYRPQLVTGNQVANGSIVNEKEAPERYIDYTMNVNYLGVILFGVAFGVAMRQIGNESETLKLCVQGLNDVMMRMVIFIMYYSPVAVIFLIAANIAKVKRIEEIGEKLALLTAASSLGMALHALILTGLYFAMVRKNPLRFIVGLKDTLMVALATASSIAALPTTIRCLESNLKVSPGITRLVMPIGATVNMDGGAVHVSLVAMYVAQLHNLHLGFERISKIAVYSAFASIGAAAIPNSFFSAILITLKAADLPTEDIGIFFATEWLLDRFKTVVNVYGDCVGASVVSRWQYKRKKEESKNDEEAKEQTGRDESPAKAAETSLAEGVETSRI